MTGPWKARAVSVPVFTGVGPDAVECRVRHSGARVLVTPWEHRARLPEPVPDGVAVVTVAGGGTVPSGDAEFWRAMDQPTQMADPVACRRDEPAVLLYPSGSTGPPKGGKNAANFRMALHPRLVHGADLR